MSTSYIPTQQRVNDPYQQRILQYNVQDSRVYLSRTSNFLLKAFGNDAYIKGFDILSYSFEGNIFTVNIDSGILIQDTTLIEITSPTILSIDVSGLDDCNGYLIVYPDYQYIESISQNQFSLKLSYVTGNGLTFMSDTEPVSWVAGRNRFYITIFRFTKGSPNVVLEKTLPEYMYLNGKKYYKLGGLLNFRRTLDPCRLEEPFYFRLPHVYDEEDSVKLITQLKNPSKNVVPITNIQLLTSAISVNVDEYEPIEECYTLVASDPLDASIFTIDSDNIPTIGINKNLYTINHNLSQKYVLVEVYDDQLNLFRPNYIKFIDDNSLVISFENVIEDLAPFYKVVIIKDNTTIIPITIDESTLSELEINHNLNRSQIIAQIVDPTDYLYNNVNNSIFNITNTNKITLRTDICDFINGDYNLIIYSNVVLCYYICANHIYRIPYHICTRRILSEHLDDYDTFRFTHGFNDSMVASNLFVTSSKIHSLSNESFLVDSNTIDYTFHPTVNNLDVTAYVYSYNCNMIYNLIDLSSIVVDDHKIYTLDLTELNITNPVFQVYDAANKKITPTEIIEDTANAVYLFKFPSTFSATDVRILVLQGFSYYTQTFSTGASSNQTVPVTILHNLNSEYLFMQIFEATTGLSVSCTSQIIDRNNLLVNLPPSSTFKINIITGLVRQLSSITYENAYYFEFSEYDLTDRSITINHNLNFILPVIQVYGEFGAMIASSLITVNIIDRNSISLNIPMGLNLGVVYKVIILSGIDRFSSLNQ